MAFQIPTLAQQYLEKHGMINPANLVWNKADTMMQDWTGNPTQPMGMPVPNEPAPWLTEAAPYMQEQIEQMQSQPVAGPKYEHEYGKQFHPAYEQMNEPSLMQNPAFISKEQEQAAQGPIAKGIETARKTPLSERVAPNGGQREKAFNRALGAFGHGMATQQSPSTSTLERISQNIYPAVEAYNANLDKARAQNIEEIKLESELEKSRRQNLTGWAQKLQSVEELGDIHGRDSDIYKNAKEATKAEVDNIKSNIRNKESLMEGRPFNQLPTADQRWITGMGNAMNINPDEMIRLTNQGKTVKEIGAMYGIDTENILPDHNPTESNIGDLKTRKAIVAEVNVLSDKVKNAVKPYAATFFHYSPAQIADALSGENIDQQAQYLAARAMAPELAVLKVAAGRGNVSLGMVQDLKESALTETRIFRPLVTPEVYEKMEEYTRLWVNEIIDAAEESTLGKRKRSSTNNASNDDPLGIR